MLENKMAKLRRNETFTGKAPYGYIWNKKTKKLEINPEEAAIYRRIVDMYLNQGKSFSDIGVELLDQGIYCKRSPFRSSSISYMLRNPAYYGNYVINQRKYKDGKRSKELKPINEHVKFPIEPIISKADWDRVQEKVKFNTVKIKRITLAKNYWLRDMLECGLCGGKVKPHHGALRKDGTFPRYYNCFWATTSDKKLKVDSRKRCHLPVIKADELEDRVWYAIVEYLTFGGFTLKGKYHPAKIEELASSQQYEERIASLEMQLKGLQAVLKRKEIAKDRLFILLEMDDYDPHDFNAKYREATAEIDKLTSQIAETQEKLTTLQNSKDQQDALKKFVQENQPWLTEIRKDLLKLGPEDKKLFVETLVQGKIKITLEYVDEGGGENWNAEIPGFRFNPSIFEQLSEKGKLSVLRPNGPLDLATAELRGGPGDLPDLQHHGVIAAGAGAVAPAAFPLPPPHHFGRRAHRRRHQPQARRGVPGPPRRALPGRTAGVQAGHPGGPAPAPGGRPGHHLPGHQFAHLPGPLHAGGGHEPLPLRLLRGPPTALHL
jgi:hypothetical protein